MPFRLGVGVGICDVGKPAAAAAPPAGLTRFPKGTANGTGLTATLAGITVAPGSVLLVACQHSVNAVVQTAQHAGNDLTPIDGQGGPACDIFILQAHPGATGDVVITFDISTGWVLLVTELQNPLASSLDQQVSHIGSATTSPTSTAAPATTVATEFLWGIIARNAFTGATQGTWSNGFTNGQLAGFASGTAMSISEGYKFVTATGAYTAQKTGTSSATYAAFLSTYA